MSVPADNQRITPPSSLCRPPITPPPSEEKDAVDTTSIRQRIENHKSGKRAQIIHNVDKRVWAAVTPLLEQHPKIRFDYFPASERLYLRMVGQVHERFLCSLNESINQQLRLISHESGPAADFARDVKDNRSTTIEPQDPEYGSHEPDMSFQHVQSPLPTVVIEIAHSQKGAELPILAEDYILGSDLEIRVVVGVDIRYRNGKRATFSIWRAQEEGSNEDKEWVVRSVVTDQVFRNDDGTPNIDTTSDLCLNLQDFADEETCRRFNNIDRDISVSCDELYHYLEAAEAMRELTKSRKPARNLQLKKRRRSRTPEEQLHRDDEDTFVEAEGRVSERQDRDDAS